MTPTPVGKAKERIRAFLRDTLKLELHPKKAEVSPADAGINFLGYVVRDGRRFLRKSTVKGFLKKERRYEAMVRNGRMSAHSWESVRASWRGYAKFADSYRLMEKLRLA